MIDFFLQTALEQMATKTKPKAKPKRRSKETNKLVAIEAIRKLSDDATFVEIADEMMLLNSIEEGLKDIEAGRFITHDELKRRMKEWLSK